MGALTTRTGLYKPGGGSTGLITPDEPADIDKINQNSDRLDEILGAPPHPSTDLPGSSVRFNGMIVYESDTGVLKVYLTGGGTWTIPVGGTRVVADLAGLPLASTLPNVKVYITALKCEFISLSGTWTQVGVARVADATARDTEYNKASGAYKTANAIVKQDDELFMRVWNPGTSEWDAYTAAIYVQEEDPEGAPDNAILLY